MSFAIGGLDDDDFYEDDIEYCAYPSRVKVWVFFLHYSDLVFSLNFTAESHKGVYFNFRITM